MSSATTWRDALSVGGSLPPRMDIEPISVAMNRLAAFWAGSSLGRPALHVTVRNAGWECQGAQWAQDRKSLDLLPEYHVRGATDYLASRHFLAESMPCASIVYGSSLTLLPVLLGGDYAYGETAWIEAKPDALDIPLRAFNPSHPVVVSLDQCIYGVSQVIENRGFINPPVLLDAMTCLSMFLGAESLCFAMMERPAVVREWCLRATEIAVAAYEHFYQIILRKGYGMTSSWLQAAAPGRFEAVQCDFSVMISPEYFATFVLPGLRHWTEYLDYSLYHLDGVEQLRFIPQLKTLSRLNGIQWNPQPSGRPAMRWIEAFREIRRQGLCLQFNACEVDGVDEAVQLTRELGPDGLMIALPMFDTVDEAVEAIERIEKASESRL